MLNYDIKEFFNNEQIFVLVEIVTDFHVCDKLIDLWKLDAIAQIKQLFAGLFWPSRVWEYLIFCQPFPTLVSFDNIKIIFQFVNSQSSWLYYNHMPFQVVISQQLHCTKPNASLAHEKQLILDLISYFLRKWIYLVNTCWSSKKNWKEVHPREINSVPSHIFLLINIPFLG